MCRNTLPVTGVSGSIVQVNCRPSSVLNVLPVTITLITIYNTVGGISQRHFSALVNTLQLARQSRGTGFKFLHGIGYHSYLICVNSLICWLKILLLFLHFELKTFQKLNMILGNLDT